MLEDLFAARGRGVKNGRVEIAVVDVPERERFEARAAAGVVAGVLDEHHEYDAMLARSHRRVK